LYFGGVFSIAKVITEAWVCGRAAAILFIIFLISLETRWQIEELLLSSGFGGDYPIFWYSSGIRKIMYTTNAIESLNSPVFLC
jgi:hypothetical protein